jgi:predicted DNA-binding transcriptional regulator AlpA
MNDILTLEELSDWLKMKPSQIYTMCRTRSQERMANPLPVLRINSNLRFRRSDIEKWLDQISQEAA